MHISIFTSSSRAAASPPHPTRPFPPMSRPASSLFATMQPWASSASSAVRFPKRLGSGKLFLTDPTGPATPTPSYPIEHFESGHSWLGKKLAKPSQPLSTNGQSHSNGGTGSRFADSRKTRAKEMKTTRVGAAADCKLRGDWEFYGLSVSFPCLI
ncbi:hypothetical protein FN846DRAFT_962417 [Sphaerosporella brunnea]|uniref:Uncharacterized protein n=1 Tax=Sphaerosporella brunnea TaxID=1250544 RepID=A0A5J5EP05_9PEZI|nr:hypothetical protein FN846DRAFT_962417 [Sphaerosporella brunnea]